MSEAYKPRNRHWYLGPLNAALYRGACRGASVGIFPFIGMGLFRRSTGGGWVLSGGVGPSVDRRWFSFVRKVI